MARVAVVRFDGSSVALHLDPGPVPAELTALLGSFDASAPEPGTWVLGPSALEPLCSVLDRLGVVWGLSTPSAPRTWAERLFAEVPPRHHRALLAALRLLLDSEPDHRAVLDYAWSAHVATHGGFS